MDIFDKYYRVYATVNLDNIEENLKKLKANVKNGTKLTAVIKTDGYGHGAVMIAKYASEYADGFAVATADEALQLRNAGIDKPILILGYVNHERYSQIIEKDIRMTVFKYEDALKASETGKNLNKTALLHIKLDTGMGRIGFLTYSDQKVNETVEIIKKIYGLENTCIEGMYTHFALADCEDKSFTTEQYNMFNKVLRILEKEGISIPVKHCSNSAAIIDMPDTCLNDVRAGIALYGLEPSGDVDIEKLDLKQAMEVKSHIIYIKEVPKNTSIGYGRTYFTKENAKIATIPVGYGDGYPRNLSNKGYVLIRGCKAPIVGRICMDQFMVDVTGIPDVQDGDIVTLAGYDNGEFINISRLAETAGTFNYEFVCDIGKRVPRIYYKDGKIVGTKDYFED